MLVLLPSGYQYLLLVALPHDDELVDLDEVSDEDLDEEEVNIVNLIQIYYVVLVLAL
jgi:hypothetical protein